MYFVAYVLRMGSDEPPSHAVVTVFFVTQGALSGVYRAEGASDNSEEAVTGI